MTGPILSRHRLPQPYRASLAALWLTPLALLTLTLVVSRGITLALFDPRLLLPLLAMALPALYVWREGVDVLPSGIIARVFVPRYYAYACLESWRCEPESALRVWDRQHQVVLECRPAHLTDLPVLLAALEDNLPRLKPPQSGDQALNDRSLGFENQLFSGEVL